MAKWWTELWSEHDGHARVYCGVARTDEGFAVDLFRDDTCLASEGYGTRIEAVRASLALRPQYAREHQRPPRPRARRDDPRQGQQVRTR